MSDLQSSLKEVIFIPQHSLKQLFQLKTPVNFVTNEKYSLTTCVCIPFLQDSNRMKKHQSPLLQSLS